MGKGYLIDSNIVVGYLDNKIPEKGMSFMHDLVDEVPNISVITKIEVLRFNAPEKAYKILIDFTDIASIYEMDEEVVDITIKLCKSSKIKLPDAIIAATALANNLTLVTRNTSDFKNIDGINLINPFEL